MARVLVVSSPFGCSASDAIAFNLPAAEIPFKGRYIESSNALCLNAIAGATLAQWQRPRLGHGSRHHEVDGLAGVKNRTRLMWKVADIEEVKP
jgi:hypothetical protein